MAALPLTLGDPRRDAIRARLLEHAHAIRAQTPPGLDLSELGDLAPQAGSLVNDLENYPHAFVLACVMDRQIPAGRAWALPWKVKERVGTFEFDDLAALRREKIERVFVEPSPLHRFPALMAHLFHSALERIATVYNGDASRIWSGEIGSATLVRRFRDFDGIGQKISTMAANILVREFGIPLADRKYIDISADVQVIRVFSRLGLAAGQGSNEQVIRAAREMNPDYPGIFDRAAWKIGRNWCHQSQPRCPECVMRPMCPHAGNSDSMVDGPTRGPGDRRPRSTGSQWHLMHRERHFPKPGATVSEKPALTALSDRTEIAQAQRKLREVLLEGASEGQSLRLGFKGGSMSAKLFWRPDLGIWFAFEQERNRYWNPFGLGSPDDVSGVPPIVVEINPPLSGIDRRIGGVFARDRRGLHLLHRGRVGGGRPGIGKKAFFTYYEQHVGNLHAVTDDSVVSPMVHLASLEEPTAAESIAAFVRCVHTFKEAAAGATNGPGIRHR